MARARRATTQATEPTRFRVAPARLNIRKTASLTAAVNGVVEGGSEIIVSGEKTVAGVQWAQTSGGWVVAEYLDLVEPEVTE